MSISEFDMFQDQQRSNWVRLRTLVTLRWFAAAGQAAAIFVAIRVYGLQIEVGYAAAVIGASILANLVSSFVYPENKRLSEREASLWLVFDIVQLSLLLFLTGGLNNPFAMLMLAPVTIAATVLHLRSTVFLGLTAIALISLISQYSLPLVGAHGDVLALPMIFQFGFWVALTIGVIFLAIYARQVTTEMHAMGEALLATQLALAREQKLTDLGGVVAAAAHELGTPLATIKLVSSEMMEELTDDDPLYEDAKLVRDQADRCRDILRSMGRAGKDDLHMRSVPLGSLVEEAAEPHQARGKALAFAFEPGPKGAERQPIVLRRPEVIHGLRNLIQNAVDFAKSKVWISGEWTPDLISIRIVDDGDGYPPQVIGRIGDPFVRSRRSAQDLARRPEYEGMGLGLFIAKTLLERTGAELTFANASDPFLTPDERPERSGAIVEVRWQIDRLVAPKEQALGENQRIEI